MILIEVRLLIRMNRQERKNKRALEGETPTNGIEDQDGKTGITSSDVGEKADNS